MRTTCTRGIILIVLAILAGCAPKSIQMDQAARESLSGVQEIKVLYYEPPDLQVPSNPVPKIFFGAIGGAVAAVVVQSRGQQMVKEYGLSDPMIRVKNGFVLSVQALFNKANLTEVTSPHKEDNLDKLKVEFHQGLFLDFKTTKWGILTHQLQGYHYVAYQGRARFVQIPEEKVIWQGVCDLEEKDDTNMPHITELEANNGALLKEYLTKLTTSCEAELIRQLSGKEVTK